MARKNELKKWDEEGKTGKLRLKIVNERQLMRQLKIVNERREKEEEKRIVR